MKRAKFKIVAVILMKLLIWAMLWASAPANVKAEEAASPWQRHTIEQGTDEVRGADGVRLADVNGDGLLDIATPWEEAGLIKIYLNPGHSKSKAPWPQVTVGKVASPEDAVFADLDGDGVIDVISSSEGETKTLSVHWAPKEKTDYLSESFWETKAIPASLNKQQWMFALPLQLDGKHGLDLVAGGKNRKAQIGWFEAPENPRDLSAWQWHSLYDAGWIMSLVAADLDRDGDLDLVASDRLSQNRGCLWFENPSLPGAMAEKWPLHRIGDVESYGDREVMFLELVDLDKDGLLDILVAIRGQELIYFRQISAKLDQWEEFTINLPENTGNAKSLKVADINLDGKLDIVFSSENARDKSSVMWLSDAAQSINSDLAAYDISGLEGIKFDLVQLIDLDGDGDLDVLTSEETTNLGVVWYENPILPR
ncbi:MAG: VCBS repeat-containing protein [Moorea sp. SIO3I7]|uniref:FG-GAP repeat domain-containing protein n=2 Tax=Moorena TaxID=1155738 RepID=UPI0013CA2793|nr:VCBS repeat-containing protein [Moorena sp. SIO3I8]NEN94007.1 VCBS repeat-containing protein [Moorena sp. SIO3I7]